MRVTKDLVRIVRWIGESLVLLILVIAAVWAFGAVWFDAPFGNANKVVAGLPSLPEFVVLLLARGRLPAVQLVTRQPQSYDSTETLFAWVRGQLWTAPDG